MKQGSNQRRSRGRGNGGRRPNRNQTFDSNGPDVKVRGTAQQVLDKYLQLARDAQSGGDRIKAEAYLQFAEHYYRILNADKDGQDSSERRSDRGDSVEAQATPNDEVPAEAPAEQKPARGRRRGGSKNEATLAAEAAAANETDGNAESDDSETEDAVANA